MIFRKKYKSPFLKFFERVIELCPEESIIEIVSNFDSNEFAKNEIGDIMGRKIRRLKECSTERQRVVLKLFAIEKFRTEGKRKESDLTLFIDNKNRVELISAIESYFDDSDICHCSIRIGEKRILESFDGFNHNGIASEISLPKEEIVEYEKAGMAFSSIE